MNGLNFTDKGMAGEMDLAGRMIHEDPHGKLLVRSDGFVVFFNATFAKIMNVNEATRHKYSIHDYVCGTSDKDAQQWHRKMYETWFNHPYPISLNKRLGKQFSIYGFNENATERVAHKCTVVIKPMTARDIGKMFYGPSEVPETFAFTTVLFNPEVYE